MPFPFRKTQKKPAKVGVEMPRVRSKVLGDEANSTTGADADAVSTYQPPSQTGRVQGAAHDDVARISALDEDHGRDITLIQGENHENYDFESSGRSRSGKLLTKMFPMRKQNQEQSSESLISQATSSPRRTTMNSNRTTNRISPSTAAAAAEAVLQAESTSSADTSERSATPYQAMNNGSSDMETGLRTNTGKRYVRKETIATSSMSLSYDSQDGNDNVYISHNEMDDEYDYQKLPTRFCCCCSSCCGMIYLELRSLIPEIITYFRAKNYKKKLLAMTVTASSVLVFYDLIFGETIHNLLDHFFLWMADHPHEAVFAFIAMFVGATLMFIPPTFLVFAAGYAFAEAIGLYEGIIAAVIASFLGSSLGAILAFLRARYLMRDLIYLFSNRYPIVNAADLALKRNGFKIMLLLRLCPLIPFNGLNYVGGITGVSWHAFALALIGILPVQILTAVMGATAESFMNRTQYQLTDDERIGLHFLMGIGVVFGMLAILLTWRMARIELAQQLEMNSSQLECMLHPAEADENGEEGVEAVAFASPDEEWFWVWT